MRAPELQRLLDLAVMTVQRNVADFTHAESLRTPDGGGSSANWILGHLVESRGNLLTMLAEFGGEPVWSAEVAEPYQRGAPVLREDAALPFEEILAAFEASQSRLTDVIVQLTGSKLDALLDEPDPFLGRTLGETISTFAWHEAYHCGQLGLLRRVVGKPGAIT